MNDSTKAAPNEAEKKKKHKSPGTPLRVFGVLFLAALILCAAGVFYGAYAKTHYRVSFYHETSEKVRGRIRIAVISDIHNREYGEDNADLISDIRGLEPDLVLFAGDMVIRDEDDYQNALDLVTALSEIAPCYGVLGNHESERIYYGNDRDLPDRFESAGLKLLRNSSAELRLGENAVQLIGVEGTAYGFEEYGGRAFMEKAVIDPAAFSIVIAHIPILFDPQLSEYDFDLGIAGHVHGGIAALPFVGGLYSSEEGFFPKYSAGRYTLAKGQTLIVSAGLGDSKAFPPRINNLPELVVIDIAASEGAPAT